MKYLCHFLDCQKLASLPLPLPCGRVDFFDTSGIRADINCKARDMLSWERCVLARAELGWSGLHVCYAVFV